MKAKNILTTLVVIVATFIYPKVTLWLVPLIISIITVSKFGKNDIAKYIGLLSLKPIFTFFLSLLLINLDLFERLYSLYPDEIVSGITGTIPELILTLGIVYAFRHLFRNDKLAWLFLLGDIIRWLSLFIESLLPDPIPEPFFYTQFYLWVFFLLVFPSLYAIVGLLSVRERVLSRSATN